MRRIPVAAGVGLLFSLGPLAAGAEVPAGPVPPRARESDQPATRPALFDPARHMRLSEVRVGMKGYGLSVFKGTKIERFDVEVLSILKNFNPKCDVVLITCRGANLEHTGAIAGMSGSPIYLRDEAGHDRMIGAFAYGWPLAKDPIAGVQPIEYMLKLPTEDPPAGAAAEGGRGAGEKAGSQSGGEASWTLDDAAARWAKLIHPAAAARPERPGAVRLAGEGELPELQPLATPLMTGGLSPAILEQFGPAFRAAGLTALQAGGGAGDPAEARQAAPLEPGSVLAVPLLTGDVEMTALGTCTEALGDRVYGFGHAFNNEGPVTLPMGSGQVSGVVATLSTSFKLGSITQSRGRLTADRTVGVAGHLGEPAPTVPIELKIVSPGSGEGAGEERTYRFRAASHPKFTPLISAAAFASAVGGASELPQYNTVDYAVDLEFSNGRTVRVADRAVNTSAGDIFQTIGLTLTAAGDNPFERVAVKKITGTVKVSAEAREGQILEVNVPRSKYKPGETVKGFVTYKPFRAPEATMPVELELPKDLVAGTYQLVISDADRFEADEQATKPFRFTAERVSEIFDVLRDVTAVRHDALYVRLIRQPDGVAVGRTALPQLPGSRRQILMASGRSNTTQFVSSTVKIIPTDRVIAGSAEFALVIETKGKGEPAARAPTSRPAAPGKGEEAKPKGKPLDAAESPEKK